MKRSRSDSRLVIVTYLTVGLLTLACFTTQTTAQPSSPPNVELRPGLVFHPTLNEAYLMKPGGIAAVDLSTGVVKWTTSAAAKPLVLVGNLLVSQVEPRVGSRTFELVALDVEQKAALKVRDATELPPGVTVSIGESLEGQFLVKGASIDGSALIEWRFKPTPRRAVEDEPDADRSRPGQRVIPPSGVSGLLQMDLSSGRLTTASPAVAKMPPRRRWVLTAGQKIDKAAPTQYESADTRNVLASELIGDGRVWDRYRWTVYERGSGRRIGEFRAHISFSPFVVRDDLLFYETTPYQRGAKAEPAKLRAVNLRTGAEAWNTEVRENVYRGPFPP